MCKFYTRIRVGHRKLDFGANAWWYVMSHVTVHTQLDGRRMTLYPHVGQISNLAEKGDIASRSFSDESSALLMILSERVNIQSQVMPLPLLLRVTFICFEWGAQWQGYSCCGIVSWIGLDKLMRWFSCRGNEGKKERSYFGFILGNLSWEQRKESDVDRLGWKVNQIQRLWSYSKIPPCAVL